MIDTDLAAIEVNTPARLAFDYVSNPEFLDRWSFGTWETTIADDGLVEGVSIFDGSRILVRIDADPARMLVDYHLGTDPENLTPRISARVFPGDWLGHGPNCCVLSFNAWRASAMEDPQWRKLKASHAFELEMLKSQIEKLNDG